jgi:hypothetical protein
MILQDVLERYGYAQLLIADYHLEYPLEPHPNTRVDLVWQPGSVENIGYLLDPEQDAMAVDDKVKAFEEVMFGPLIEKYGMHYEPGMNLWLLQGSLSGLAGVFDRHAQNLMGGSGGDDDTFDYWPNAFEMLMMMAQDLIDLGHKSPQYLIGQVERVITSAIAVNGPLKEWEAEDLPLFLINLKGRAAV